MERPYQLRIHARLQGRYRVFDRSGQLHFSVVFGLCRVSPADKDPRPLLLDTRCSVLDVPYALANKLLTLHEYNTEDKQEAEVDLSRLTHIDGNGTYITLSSPVKREETKWEAFTTYQCPIKADSELASIFEAGKKYTIRLASNDLCVQCYAYGERSELLSSSGRLLQSSEVARLVNSKDSSGKASFTVVSSLPWPPTVKISMRHRASEGTTRVSQTLAQGATIIEVTVTNTGDRTISVQSCGRQHYLVPWGPFQPEEPTEDTRPRIIHASESSRVTCLQFFDPSSGALVRDAAKPAICGLYVPHTERRPKLSDLVTLKPGEPLIRTVNINNILPVISDGRYKVRLQSREAWWCFGSVEEILDGSDNRVPQRLYKTTIPPLLLECEDVIDLQIKGGHSDLPPCK